MLTLDFSHDLLAGPVYVEGAGRGDILAVELLDTEPKNFGFSAILPGFGFLADVFPGPYLLTWELDDRHARSSELPGIAIPADPFPGTIGVAPSRELLDRVRQREDELARRVGLDLLSCSPPAVPAAAADGLGTLRHAKSGAIWTSGTSPAGRACSCPCTCQARCSHSATSTSPRAKAKSVAPRSRSAPR